MNDQAILLQRNARGKPEGPYEDTDRVTAQGTDVSLFEDDDGTVCWLVGQGWIAKVKPDFSGLEAQPQLLRGAPFESGKHGKFDMPSPHAPRYLGMAGAYVFKGESVYYLTGAHVRDRIGVGCYDPFIAFSETLMGPYRSPHIMIAHGGQSTVFKGADDRWWVRFGERDRRAIFRDRPAILPLRFSNAVQCGKYSKTPFRANLARSSRSSLSGPK